MTPRATLISTLSPSTRNPCSIDSADPALQMARAPTAAPTAKTANPTAPVGCDAPPVKDEATGLALVAMGFDPFIEMLLTSRDGQGVDSVTIGMLRVMVLSAGAEGQAVPQGASTVERLCRSMSTIPSHVNVLQQRTSSPEH